MIRFSLAKFGVVAIAAIFVCGQNSGAQQSLADLDTFRNGCLALTDGRYETASTEFEKAWAQLEADDAGEIERDFVASRLLESLVRNQQSAVAVQWLQRHAPLAPSLSTLKWSAIAYQAEERFSEAAQAYSDLAAALPALSHELSISRVVCLARSGRAEAAYQLMDGILTPEVPAEFLQFAQIASRAKRFEVSLNYLAELEKEEALPFPVRFRAAALKASLLAEQGQEQRAISEVYSVIEAATTAEEAHKAFLLLEEISADAPIPDLSKRFEEWTSRKNHPASHAAGFFSLVFLTEPQERESRLAQWLEQNTDSPFAIEARIRLQNSTLEEEWLPEDSDSLPLPGGEDRLSFELASSRYLVGQYEDATRQFLAAASRQSGQARARNLYNAALSSLQENEFSDFLGILNQLEDHSSDSPRIADLHYLAGLYLASKGDLKAVEFLQPFVREYPNHPSNVEARLALAEIHLNQAPARPQAAREIFEGLRTQPLTLAQSERLDYTAVWLDVIDNNEAGLVSGAGAFLRNWPGSTYLPEISMLLARENYQNNNFETARPIFDRIANDYPDSPFAEAARFFAAKSTPAGPDAVSRWEAIANSDETHAASARHELGLLFLSLEQFENARREFRSITGTEPEDSPLRYAALADLAFSYYAEALTNDGEVAQFKEAAKLYAELADTPSATKSWRYNAAVRRGKCLEALGQTETALEIYHSIVDDPAESDFVLSAESSLPAIEWTFRAGFIAIDIMSSKEDWEGAIRMADLLSRKDGPRAIEASRFAEQLRLKHWIWN